MSRNALADALWAEYEKSKDEKKRDELVAKYPNTTAGMKARNELSKAEFEKAMKEKNKTLLDVTPVRVKDTESHTEEIRAFAHAIRTGGRSPIPGEQALMATRILDGIYASAKAGREVRI